MNPTIIFYVVLLTKWAEYLWELYLSLRQHHVFLTTLKVPPQLKGHLSDETFEKSRLYALDRIRSSMFKETIEVFLFTIIICNYVIKWFWDLSTDLTELVGWEGEMKVTIFFVIILNTFNVLVSLPIKIYDIFVIEERHGFNKQTPRFFVKDQIKSFLMIHLIVVPISCACVAIVSLGGDYFFVYLWVFATLTLLFLMTIYPDFIAPLFDKYTPLAEGELKTEIEKLAASVNFPLFKIYLVEGSKRSVHSNAYFYGFFKNKRIVLFDTLLKNGDKGCDNSEILAILAHELGHWKFNHVFKYLVISQVNLFVQFAAFGILFNYSIMYQAFDFYLERPVIIGLIIALQFVFAPYNTVFSFFGTVLSRTFEFQADNFAKKMNKTEALKKALVKLHIDNLSFPVYDRLYSAWHHTHPTLLQRLNGLQKED